jgi:transcriptional regulator with XRE-family HTH domain
MTIQEKIKTLRMSRGWTQENIAEMLCLSPNGYSNIERGITEMTLSRLTEIANLFGLDLVGLLSFGEANSLTMPINQETELLKVKLTAKDTEISLLKQRIKDLERLTQFV